MPPHKYLYESASKALQSKWEQSIRNRVSSRTLFNWTARAEHNPYLVGTIFNVRRASGKCKGPPKGPPPEKAPSFCEPTRGEPPCSPDVPPCEKIPPYQQSQPPPINKDCKPSEEKYPCPKREPRKEKKKKQASNESTGKAETAKDTAPKGAGPKAAAPKPGSLKDAPKDAAPKANPPKAAAPKEAASKAAAPKDAAPKSSAVPPPPPPPPPPPAPKVSPQKPVAQKPPAVAEPSSAKPAPPPPPPPAKKIPPPMPPPATAQPVITQYKSAMPNSPSPCERPPKPKEGEKKPPKPSKKEPCQPASNPCMLAFMKKNRLEGKTPPTGCGNAGKSSSKAAAKPRGRKHSAKRETSSGSKPTSKNGGSAGSKPPPKEGATSVSKPSPKEGASPGNKPTSKGPAGPAGKPPPPKGPANPGQSSSSPTISKPMTTAANAQPKVSAPPPPPPPPPPPAPLPKAKVPPPPEQKAKSTPPAPAPLPPPPAVKPSPSQSTQAGGDQCHCEAHKPQLQCQPVVPLKDTIQRYLCSIQPLLTPDEFVEEQKLALEFQDGEGAKLQTMLEDVAKCSSNWLTPRWTNAAYLGYRAPVTIFSSPCLTLPMQSFKTNRDYMLFTAKVIFGMCEFKELVDNNGIPVMKMCCHDLDNSQFRKIFGTVRKPGRFCDTIEQHEDSQYAVIIHKNNFFKLPLFGADCKIAHVHSLADQLGSILHCPMERGLPIGLLTHDNRDNWGEAYTYLCGSEGNNESIVQVIEQSLFIVCLDDRVEVPKKGARAVHAAQLLHGGGSHQNSANRWMDKTIQLIVNPNGMAGFCYEHAPADCQPLAMLMDFVQEKITQPNYGCQCCSNSKVQPATVLCFDRFNQCTELYLCEARRNIDKISSRLQLHVFKYECHGKDFIKAQGLNADSYIQMALQLAYYNLHGKLPAQYESAHLLMFEQGRTETVRSTSKESRAFIQAMTRAPVSNKKRLLALRNAVDSHQELTKFALQGRGIDRHLLGLQQMAKEQGLAVPKFFQSKGYVKSVSFQVFSSQVPSRHDAFMAYGPLVANGYGCCYNPRNMEMIFSVSAWGSNRETDPVLYGKAIGKALDSMRKLVLQTGGDRVGEDVCKCTDEMPPK